MPDTYVIFICDYDPVEDELYHYTIMNWCEENGKHISDGNHTIWLSTKGTNASDEPKALVDFLKYVENPEESEDTEDSFIKSLKYLADLDEQAQNRLDCIIAQIKETEGVTEKLKAKDQLAWVGHMNSIRHRAEEVIRSAITDGVDSLTRQEMDITPFKNILNDMYSRNISKKVLAGRMTRSRKGKFCGGQPPLGLMRDPEDKGHLICDPETAPIIRKIYDMALDGWGCMRIAKQLMDDKVPITRVKSNTECDVNYYSWGSARISHILRNPFYKGAHLVFRTHQKGIRSNTYDIIPREDWEIIEDCHEAIISPEEWEQVQEIIDRRPTIMKGNSCPFYNLFHGIIYCATCGKSMQVRYEKVGRTGKNRFTGEQREPIEKPKQGEHFHTYYLV